MIGLEMTRELIAFGRPDRLLNSLIYITNTIKICYSSFLIFLYIKSICSVFNFGLFSNIE